MINFDFGDALCAASYTDIFGEIVSQPSVLKQNQLVCQIKKLVENDSVFNRLPMADDEGAR